MCGCFSGQLPAVAGVRCQVSGVRVSKRRQDAQDFNRLAVWRRSHTLTLDVYRRTDNFPRAEMFGLTSQLRRAAASVAANLAEGSGRTQAEFGRFVQISMGSACEVEYHLLLARDLGYLPSEEYERLAEEIRAIKRMLTALLKTVRGREAKFR